MAGPAQAPEWGVHDFAAERRRLLADRSLGGGAFCRAHSDLADRWLARLLAEAASDQRGVALVAVGGYGRRELAPGSDLDVLLLHDEHRDLDGVPDKVWYPIWDAGLKLGHAVRTVKQALALAADDLDTATAMLDARHIAGDEHVGAELSRKVAAQWQKRSKRWLGALARAVDVRHARAGEVAFLLEPDLKEGRGGLRDVHALAWAEAAHRVLLSGDADALSSAYGVLLDARVELHRRTGKANDRLLLQEQDAVAEALGDPDADALMARIAAAARSVAWTSDETWDRIRSSLRGPIGRLAHRDRPLAAGIVLRDDEVHVDGSADTRGDPALVLRVAACAARQRARITRASLDRLAADVPVMPDPWPAAAREALVELLGTGHQAVAVLEALDQRGLLVRVLPEWEPVRSRPQRNAYHRYTVDRHLCEAAAEAAALVDRVARPDLLLVGTWLHDLGKGYPGDHTEVGMELVKTIGRRMGFPPDDVSVLVELVHHHLLLPDVATRRDLADEGTVRLVADAVRSPETLELLAALTEADSIATGPAAWGHWKAGLVAELTSRVRRAMGAAEEHEPAPPAFPTPELQALMDRRQLVVEVDSDTITIVAPDRPGLFSRVAGVLTLSGLDVLAADAHSSDDGMAVEMFQVAGSHGRLPDADRLAADVRRALSGRLAIEARLRDRARVYGERLPQAATPAEPRVHVDNDASAAATVIEVRAPDGIGVLYRITRALADLDLDIRHAKVQTLGHEVVDSFYVRDAGGSKVTDPEYLAEVERAILAGLS